MISNHLHVRSSACSLSTRFENVKRLYAHASMGKADLVEHARACKCQRGNTLDCSCLCTCTLHEQLCQGMGLDNVQKTTIKKDSSF
jgi:hypothetical protein